VLSGQPVQSGHNRVIIIYLLFTMINLIEKKKKNHD